MLPLLLFQLLLLLLPSISSNRSDFVPPRSLPSDPSSGCQVSGAAAASLKTNIVGRQVPRFARSQSEYAHFFPLSPQNGKKNQFRQFFSSSLGDILATEITFPTFDIGSKSQVWFLIAFIVCFFPSR